MIGRRGLALLGAAAALTVAAAAEGLRDTRSPASGAGTGRPLLGDLDARRAEAASLRVEGGSGPVAVERRAGAWVVASKAGYPADGRAVEAVLDGLAGLRTETALTARPALWPRLGLGDPGTGPDGAAGTRLTVAAADGTVLADGVLGPSAPPRVGPDGVRAPALYARRTDGERAWRVRGAVALPARPVDWLDRTVVDLPAGRIARLTAAADGGPPVVLVPTPQEEGAAGRTRDGSTLAAAALEDLRLADVRPAGDLAGVEPVSVARAITADGLSIAVRQVADPADPSVRWTLLAAEALPDAGADAAAEARALNARWDGWAYRLPDHRSRRLAPTDDHRPR